MSVLKIKNVITGEWESVPFVNNSQKIGVVAGDNIELTPQGQDIKISAIVPDTSNLATKDEVATKQPKGDYALISDIPSLENYVKNTDFATQTVAGVVRMWTSTDEEGNIGLNISTGA